MITTDIKNKITEAIRANRGNYPSDAKHAASLGVTTSVYSAIKNGQTDRVLSDANWISIARKLGVSLRGEIEWKIARTETFDFIMTQLELAQTGSLSGILCDIPNIGKTFTARHYVKTHPNAVYIDCSQVKTKLKLVRKIAAEFGTNSRGRYSDVYDDLVYYLRSIDNPLIILDEAGDLQYEAFLELKALWNATERCCAWYMMGADGLKEKINRSIECRKVGYTEMLSRYGDRYSKVSPDDGKDRARFLMGQARAVAKLNAPAGVDPADIARRSGGGLRRVYTEIEKLKRQ
ncbi:ATP-binding protein [Duncaniella sp. C9]|uniref:ATP-binding protein n=1 Tax=Muribaculaceae TaxID=2005473 RepID=UPI0010A46196|nr:MULTISPECIES: ATP-binding protein [Muribaculaceae]MCX4333235.1 ATP-binding protein [Paramuribaculum sp.]QCD40607.1 ATP-binding protein [Duncaniella sp. C9]QCP71712.1 ATP-binding protein [Duncaniella sp. B8]